ncbi:MAG: transcription termination/antitermination protein NusA, partial [Selenomonadaceae bacterium]|nr:transcription termination/antitermination protein NusA [Selenomonadaceae bacterium]
EGEEKVCRVRVPDSQLSLAIGNKGQNARLAAKLTGWKIDIKSVSQAEGEELEAGMNEVQVESDASFTAEGDA